jgi:hypothetical protein
MPRVLAQNGIVVDDVALPPWAQASADRFVRLMRQALESVRDGACCACVRTVS